MSLGHRNPLPFRIGGGPTPTEEIYEALRSARGTLNPPEGSLQDLFDWSRAKGIAAGQSAMERALLQGFPDTMTDHLPVWERVLKLPSSGEIATRQIAVARAMTAIINATVPGLVEGLQKIDARFTVEDLGWTLGTSTVHGKAFQGLPDLTPPAPFGSGVTEGLVSTPFPNYSTGFLIYVRYLLPAGAVEPPARAVADAKVFLNKQLPFFIGFELYALTSGGEGEGFYLDGGDDDTSRMDITGL